jgi:hypothetical protein
MRAHDNPSTTAVLLGLGLVAAAGFAFVSMRKGEGAGPPSANPVSLVRDYLMAKGKDVSQLQFRAQAKGDDVMVQVRDPKKGKTYTYGVRNGKVKEMSSKVGAKVSPDQAKSKVKKWLDQEGQNPDDFTFRARPRGAKVEVEAKLDNGEKLIFAVGEGKDVRLVKHIPGEGKSFVDIPSGMKVAASGVGVPVGPQSREDVFKASGIPLIGG